MRTKLLKIMRKRFVWSFNYEYLNSKSTLYDRFRIEEMKFDSSAWTIQRMVREMCRRLWIFIIYTPPDVRNIPRKKRALLKKYQQTKTI